MVILVNGLAGPACIVLVIVSTCFCHSVDVQRCRQRCAKSVCSFSKERGDYLGPRIGYTLPTNPTIGFSMMFWVPMLRQTHIWCPLSIFHRPSDIARFRPTSFDWKLYPPPWLQRFTLMCAVLEWGKTQRINNTFFLQVNIRINLHASKFISKQKEIGE